MSLDNPSGSNESEATLNTGENSELHEPTETVQPASAEEAFYGKDPAQEESGQSEETESRDVVESESAEASETEDGAKVFSLKANGEEVELTESEIKEYASKGLNYTRDKMALSTERKEFQSWKANEADRLGKLAEQMESYLREQDGAINWDELKNYDPSEYVRQKEILQNRHDALAKAKKEHADLVESQRNELVESEAQKLLDTMKEEWKDSKVREEDLKSASEYLKSHGMTDKQMKDVTSSALYMAAIDAAKYRKLMASRDVVRKEVNKAPKTVKPSKASTPTKSIEEVFYGSS